MEVFKNKSLVLKIVIALVIVILFNFCAPTLSHAGVTEVIGGTLLSPIIDLLLAIGDGAINLIQSILFGMDNSLLKVAVHEASFWETVGMVVGAVVGIAAVVAITIVSGGTALAAIVPALIAGGVGAYAGHKIAVEALPDTFYLPVYAISPEEIFQNKIGLLDVNFFNPNAYEEQATVDGQSVEQESTAANLQATISSWYLTLRNFALVVLLVVLLYVGIRVVTSSAAQDRAKYKEKLFSWIVAMCLLFFMHYIMAFATTIVEAISEGINTASKPVIITLPDLSQDDYEVEVTTTDPDTGEQTSGGVPAEEFFSNDEIELIATDPDTGESTYAWPTNLMGTLRIDMQMDANLTEDNQLLRQLGYVVLFLVLVFYTIAFLVVYIRRLIMLAFLTMIAPLVAMTYPLDKMHDGNAQAFNMWIKEYVFNLLIQPFHLILYTMLVGSAIDFAHKNMIYAIVAIGFIFQAEKILRKFFGFDKASTLDTNGSTIGGMLAMAGINQLKKIGNMGKKSGGKNGGGNSGSGNSNPRVRTADRGKSARERLDQAGNSQGGGGGELPPPPENREGQYDNNDDENKTANQRMLDAYDEGYGTDDWDPQERDAWAREAYEPEPMNYSAEEYAQILRDSGYEEADIEEMMRSDPRYANNFDDIPSPEAVGQGDNEPEIPEPEAEPVDDSTAPQRLRDRLARSNISKPIKGVAGVAGAGLKYAIPKAGKLYAKAALGIAAGTLGVAAGLASDNDMNILKYGGAGAATGWAVGGAAGGIITNADHKVEEIGEKAVSAYTIAAGGQEAEKKRLQAKEDKAAMKDKDRRKMYLDKVENASNKNLDEIMKDAQEYRESGVTDDKLIIKAMNAKGFGDGRANNERVILAQLANETGGDNKKIGDLRKRLEERGLDKKDVDRYIEGIREITGSI